MQSRKRLRGGTIQELHSKDRSVSVPRVPRPLRVAYRAYFSPKDLRETTFPGGAGFGNRRRGDMTTLEPSAAAALGRGDGDDNLFTFGSETYHRGAGPKI